MSRGLLSLPKQPFQKRNQTPAEEWANSISHGFGLIAALAAAPGLINFAIQVGDLGFIIGSAVFSASMVFLYFCSMLYHGLRPGPAKERALLVEHAAIFGLISGSYTPFALGVLRDSWGELLFVLVWGLAIVGTVLKVRKKIAHPMIHTGIYVCMGWIVLVAAEPVTTTMPASGLVWLVAGGLAYTIGVAFYATDAQLPFGHLIWHLFVMAGTACHYVAVLESAAV